MGIISTVLMLLFIVLLSAVLYCQIKIVRRSSSLEKSQDESSSSLNSAVCAAIIAAVNLHKSKQR
ncbi:MAG: hypothetical protein LBB59_02420 [Campylobacteraceae bacterium]|nr:hypothetical protein [Campylobacteraceae bacterium]